VRLEIGLRVLPERVALDPLHLVEKRDRLLRLAVDTHADELGIAGLMYGHKTIPFGAEGLDLTLRYGLEVFDIVRHILRSHYIQFGVYLLAAVVKSGLLRPKELETQVSEIKSVQLDLCRDRPT